MGINSNDLRTQVMSVGYSFNYFYLEERVIENCKMKSKKEMKEENEFS